MSHSPKTLAPWLALFAAVVTAGGVVVKAWFDFQISRQHERVVASQSWKNEKRWAAASEEVESLNRELILLRAEVEVLEARELALRTSFDYFVRGFPEDAAKAIVKMEPVKNEPDIAKAVTRGLRLKIPPRLAERDLLAVQSELFGDRSPR